MVVPWPAVRALKELAHLCSEIEVELSIDRCCLYTDEPAHIEWHVTCANCADMWTHFHGARLEEDRTSRSGTQVEYFFEGGGSTRIDAITMCLLPRRGDMDVNHAVAFGTEPGSAWIRPLMKKFLKPDANL